MFAIGDSTRRWWILAAMGGVLGLIVLDETVIGVALPSLRGDLGLSQVTAHWVINVYLLVFTGLAVAGGKLGDILDLKLAFCGGVALFGLASLASGFAQNGTWIITARAVQGIGAAIIFPNSVAIITGVFPERQRGLAFGIYTAVGGAFMSLGPLVGGFFTETLSWRWIFWVNLPVVAAVIVLMWSAWRPPAGAGAAAPGPAKTPFDALGLMTLVAGLGGTVLGVMQASEWGWTSPLTLGFLLVGTLSLVAFVWVEQTRPSPLIKIALFRDATFSAGNMVIFAGEFGKMSVVVFAALFMRDVLHMSPISAGLLLLTGVVPTLFASLVAGRLADRFGARGPALIGLLFNGAGILWLGLMVPEESQKLLVPGLLLWGASLPFLYVPTRRAVMGSVTAAERGQAGGISLTSQLFGGTLGMTVCGAVLTASGDYRALFLVAAALSLSLLLVGWFTLERRPAAVP